LPFAFNRSPHTEQTATDAERVPFPISLNLSLARVATGATFLKAFQQHHLVSLWGKDHDDARRQP
jgi:hypothetical protein